MTREDLDESLHNRTNLRVQQISHCASRLTINT
jgi:hypothetical protein